MQDKVTIGSTGEGESDRINYRCPGCGDVHSLSLKVWTWNGDREKPTFSPSVLTTSGHYTSNHKAGDDCWCTFNRENPDVAANQENVGKGFECYRCHSFVRDGMAEFLSDCTHTSAGKTLPLKPFTAHVAAATPTEGHR